MISENIENVKIAQQIMDLNGKQLLLLHKQLVLYLGLYPNLNSQLCKIKIYDAVDGEPSDVSDSVSQ